MIYGTNFRYASLLSNISQTQIAMNKLQYSIATGNKAQTFADQPKAAALVHYKSSIAHQQQTIDNSEMAQIRLNLVSTAVEGIDDIAIAARKASAVPGYEDANARNLQHLARQWLAATVDFLNSKGDNGYIFGGLRTDEQPVTYPSIGSDPITDASWTTGPGATVAAGSPNGFFAVTTNPGPPATAVADVPAAFSAATNADYRNYYYSGGAGVDLNTGASDDGLTVRVDRASSVAVGFSAAEPGFERLLRGLHLLAVAPLPDENAANFEEQKATYQFHLSSAHALIDQASQDIRGVHMRAASALNFVNDKLENQKEVLGAQQKIADELQGADKTEAIVKLQTLQTNLSASYEVTSRLQEYSLLKYI